MHYRHNIDYCFEERLGKSGVSKVQLTQLLSALAPNLAALKNRKDVQAAPILALPSRTTDIDAIIAQAMEIKTRFKHVIVAGAGGSGLSGRTLAALKPFASSPSLHFLENIDPDAIDAALAGKEPANTCFIFISKSGTTAETIGHFYSLLTQLTAKKISIADHFIVITCATDNPLRQAANTWGCRVLDHDADIGGRFSILTVVGLLPAALLGLDIRALRQGAQSVVAEMDAATTPDQCQPAIGAALHVAFMNKHIPISVFFPYAERLSGLGSWWRQSWAESLGKNGKGTTPICAMGSSDQHSQLQLYLDGPKDKFFHLVLIHRAGTGHAIAIPEHPSLAYLRAKTTGDIMEAEQKATLETLIRSHCPVRLFELDTLTEESMGALLMHLTLEIIFAAGLLGVNPFDQPAVEESKRLAREYLLTGQV